MTTEQFGDLPVEATAPAEPPAVAPLQPAGFWIRALARILDQVVLGGVGLVVGVLFVIVAAAMPAMTGRSPNEMLESMESTSFIGWIGGFIATIVYHSMFESVAGSTAGKRMLGLQVISMDGSPIGFRQGLIRSAAFLVDAMFLAAIAALAMHESPEKQRVGDKWADTRVVKRRSLPPQSHPSTLQFFAAFVAAVQSAAVIVVLTQVLDYLWYIRAT